jgi:hypothetical protein
MHAKRTKFYTDKNTELMLRNIIVASGLEGVLANNPNCNIDIALETVSSYIAMIQQQLRSDIDDEIVKYRRKITEKLEKTVEYQNAQKIINELRDLYMKARDVKTTRRLGGNDD